MATDGMPEETRAAIQKVQDLFNSATPEQRAAWVASIRAQLIEQIGQDEFDRQYAAAEERNKELGEFNQWP